jgi:hypothetical protein
VRETSAADFFVAPESSSGLPLLRASETFYDHKPQSHPPVHRARGQSSRRRALAAYGMNGRVDIVLIRPVVGF